MRMLFAVAGLGVAIACASSTESSEDAGKGGSGGLDLGDAGLRDIACTDAESGTSVDAATGCTGADAGGVRFSTDVMPIMAGCKGEVCHGPPSYQWLVGVKAIECCDGRLRVAPGNAQQSYLIDKLEGTQLCGGVRMPFGGAPLPDATLEIIIRWICEGAPDN